MKKFIAIIAIMLSGSTFSQVIIGGSTGTATDKTGVLLEFATDGNKGIILPYTDGEPANAVGGTFVFDVTSGVNKIKVKKEDGTWRDLSMKEGDDANVNLVPQTGRKENAEAKVIIGNPPTNTTPDGILVLNSKTKAMVLPHVNSYADVFSPSAGMMVFETSTQRLAVFNGTKWTFWKAAVP